MRVDPTLPAMLRRLFAEHADREAIICGRARHTYADLEHISGRLGLGLARAGAGKAARIGILMPNGADFVAAWAAVSRIGALPVPLSTLAKPPELRALVAHADIQYLLVAPEYLGHDYARRLLEAFPDLSNQRHGALELAEAPHLKGIWFTRNVDQAWADQTESLMQDGKELAARRPYMLAALESSVDSSDLGILIYSSGSTGDPKGVLHTHGAITTQSANIRAHRHYTDNDRLLTSLPFFWVGGLVVDLIAAVSAGACVICPEGKDTDEILQLVRDEHITFVSGWLNQRNAIMNHPSFRREDFPSVRYGFDRPADETGNPAPQERVPNALGMTESLGPHSHEPLGTLLPRGREGSFGRGMPSVERRIVDPDTGAVLPPGEPGELCIRGHQVCAGLYKRDSDTVFDREGFYRTGDRCYITRDGYLYFLGRLDDMIKTRGTNVSPQEVQDAITAMDEVADATVLGLPDAEVGELVVAAIVLYQDEHLTLEDIRARLKDKLSSYKLPQRLYVLKEADIPRSAGGKVRRTLLRDLLQSRVAA